MKVFHFGTQYPTVNKSAIALNPQLTRVPSATDGALDADLESVRSYPPARSSTMNCHREPTLNGLLSDPLVRAVMEADGVNPLELEEMLRRVAQRLRIPSGQKSPPD
jgi:hypothetical protein